MPMAENSGDAYQIEKKITDGESEAYKAPKPREYRKVSPALKRDVDQLVWRITQFELGAQDEVENRDALRQESGRLYGAIVKSPLFQNTILPQMEGAAKAGFPYKVERKYKVDYDVDGDTKEEVEIKVDTFDGFTLKATGGRFEDIEIDLDARYNELFPEDANLEEQTAAHVERGEKLLKNSNQWAGLADAVGNVINVDSYLAGIAGKHRKEAGTKRTSARKFLESAGMDINQFAASFGTPMINEDTILRYAEIYFTKDNPENNGSSAERARVFLEQFRDDFVEVKPALEAIQANFREDPEFDWQKLVEEKYNTEQAEKIKKVMSMMGG